MFRNCMFLVVPELLMVEHTSPPFVLHGICFFGSQGSRERLDRAFADERMRRLLRSDWLHGSPENDVAPGNRRCAVCGKGPRWCCSCPCSGCGFANGQCKCEVGQYELHPFMTSWESQWHTVGHRQDFKRGICVLTETVRELLRKTSRKS